MRPSSWAKLTDAQRTWVLLNQAGRKGIHSWELGEQVPTRNASQRVKDCVSKGVPVWTTTERRNGRPGARYWLMGAPDEAVPVEPNRTGTTDAAFQRADSGAEPKVSEKEVRPRSTLEALVLERFGGRREMELSEFEQPELAREAAA